MAELIQVALAAAGLFLAVGTFVSWSSHPHWLVRGWDYPRPQIAVLLSLIGSVYYLSFGADEVLDRVALALMALAILEHARHVARYTPLHRPHVRAVRGLESRASDLRVLVCNVQMENHCHDRVLAVVRATDPDVALLVETDERWATHLAALHTEDGYAYRVVEPRPNHYGMCLFSKLELVEPRLRTLVDDGVPSIHTGIRLRDGVEIGFHGLHPRPPEPRRDQDSAERDAELVQVAEMVASEERPTVVAGDLNDVAWSPTTSLFLRLSRMIDPRMGRGFFNTWNANSRFLRLPLDHVFHTDDFELVELEVLGNVGSDHFPVLAELRYRRDAAADAETPAAGDEKQAREKLDLADHAQEERIAARRSET